MELQRTQIYLKPDQHRRLLEEAARRGTSLAALLRVIVAEYLGRGGRSEVKGFDAIIGIARAGAPTDVAQHERGYRAEAADRVYQRKMGAVLRVADSRPRRREKRK